MVKRRKSLKEAWHLVKSARPVASPHEKYWEQLRQLEVREHGSVSLTSEDVGPTLQDQLRMLRLQHRQENSANGASKVELESDSNSSLYRRDRCSCAESHAFDGRRQTVRIGSQLRIRNVSEL